MRGERGQALEMHHLRPRLLTSCQLPTSVCRAAGSPAGSFPHTPWWHCVLHDPYERINVWSHAVPGLVLLVLAALAAAGGCARWCGCGLV